jgi:hypothetical protein
MVVDAMFPITIALCGRLLPQPIADQLGALEADRIIGGTV